METEDKVKKSSTGRLDPQRLTPFGQPDAVFRQDTKKQDNIEKDEFRKYKSLKIFKTPVQLISSDGTERLHYNEEAVAELLKVNHKVNVVAVVGLYRTGKSLLLNRLAGVNKAFEIGHTCNATTVGIWIMCKPHPTQESQVLVLLDTEGLGAVLENKLLDDKWNFLIATLLSSTLVYNNKGVLDSDAVQKLSFLTELKSSMSVLETEYDDDSYFDVFFPSFVLVNRDFSLKLTDKANNPISADEYLEKALATDVGVSDSVQTYNTPRLLVRKYFKERKCFVISPPSNPRALNEERILRTSVFENNIDELIRYIYACKPKRMTSGKVLNGRMLGSLVRSYTKFLEEGKPPCIYTAVKDMVEYENQNIIEQAQNVYKKAMHDLIGKGLPNDETMSNFHLQCTEKAINYLKREIIYDDVELFMDTAMASFNQVLDKLIRSITKDSEKLCWGKLSFLDKQRVQRNISLKAYQHVSGYDEYMADVEWVVDQYKKAIGLGPKKTEVLQSYLECKEQEEKKIHQLVRAAEDEQGTKAFLPDKENIRKRVFTRLSQDFESLSIHELIGGIKNDQARKKQELINTFQHFKVFKDKELDRQIKENAAIASETEKEIEQYNEMFLNRPKLTEKKLVSSLEVNDSVTVQKDSESASALPFKRQYACKIL